MSNSIQRKTKKVAKDIMNKLFAKAKKSVQKDSLFYWFFMMCLTIVVGLYAFHLYKSIMGPKCSVQLSSIL